MICFVVVRLSVLDDSHDLFSNIFQGCPIGTGPIVTQIASTLGSTSIRYRSNNFVTDRWVFAIWEVVPMQVRYFLMIRAKSTENKPHPGKTKKNRVYIYQTYYAWKTSRAKLHFNSLAPGKFECNFRYVIFQVILVIDGWGISCEIAQIWLSVDFTDDQPTLVPVMAWCRQATSHYLSQCWPKCLTPYGVTRPQWVKAYTGN